MSLCPEGAINCFLWSEGNMRPCWTPSGLNVIKGRYTSRTGATRVRGWRGPGVYGGRGVQSQHQESNIPVGPSADDLAYSTLRDMEAFCQCPLSIFSSPVQLPDLKYLLSIQPGIVVSATTRYIGHSCYFVTIKRQQMSDTDPVQAPDRDHFCTGRLACLDFEGDPPCKV
jgi:hypothetical protein